MLAARSFALSTSCVDAPRIPALLPTARYRNHLGPVSSRRRAWHRGSADRPPGPVALRGAEAVGAASAVPDSNGRLSGGRRFSNDTSTIGPVCVLLRLETSSHVFPLCCCGGGRDRSPGAA